MNELVRDELIRIVRENGEDVLLDPVRAKAFLNDFCGNKYRREINSITLALKEGAATELLNSRRNRTERFAIARLSKNLEESFGFPRQQTIWTVESIAIALGVISQDETVEIESVRSSELERFPETKPEEARSPQFIQDEEKASGPTIKVKKKRVALPLMGVLSLLLILLFIFISVNNNKSPNAPSNPSPTNYATNQPLTVTLSWDCSDPDGDAVTYDVYFGTNTNPTTKISSEQSGKTLSRSNLLIGTTYYWKVVAKDAKGATTEGPVWRFTTQSNRPPDMPYSPNPANNATNQPLTITLSWTCSDPDGDAVTYDVYFDTKANPTTKISTNQSGKTLNISILSYGTTYYWKVVAKDSKGGTTEGPVWRFTTQSNRPPDMPYSPNPANNATNQPLTIALSWECSDPDGDAVTYDVYFGTNSNPPKVAPNQSGKTLSIGNLSAGTKYYWKVVARDSKGATTEGPEWRFTTQSAPKTSSYTPSSVVPQMVLVEKGSFTMGDTWGGGFSDAEKPTHKVMFTYDFEIGKCEVTFNEYDSFCNATGRSKPKDESWGRGNRPVINVSWWDAISYCNWLSEKEGLSKAYDNKGNLLDKDGRVTTDPSKVVGYRLPTEAEWEYAARGGNKSKGHKYSGSDTIDDVAWYWQNSGDKYLTGDWDWEAVIDNNCKTQEVGKKAPNELGLYDMSGNVWEWCSDWYGSYSSSAQTNPYNNSGSSRVIRGGSWYYEGMLTRVTFRTTSSPTYTNHDLGFRIARTVP